MGQLTARAVSWLRQGFFDASMTWAPPSVRCLPFPKLHACK
jgi:hypothetical protein